MSDSDKKPESEERERGDSLSGITDSFMFGEIMKFDTNQMLDPETADSKNKSSNEKDHNPGASDLYQNNESFIKKLQYESCQNTKPDNTVKPPEPPLAATNKPIEEKSQEGLIPPGSEENQQDLGSGLNLVKADSIVVLEDPNGAIHETIFEESSLSESNISTDEKRTIIQKKLTKNESDIKSQLTESQIMFKQLMSLDPGQMDLGDSDTNPNKANSMMSQSILNMGNNFKLDHKNLAKQLQETSTNPLTRQPTDTGHDTMFKEQMGLETDNAVLSQSTLSMGNHLRFGDNPNSANTNNRNRIQSDDSLNQNLAEVFDSNPDKLLSVIGGGDTFNRQDSHEMFTDLMKNEGINSENESFTNFGKNLKAIEDDWSKAYNEMKEERDFYYKEYLRYRNYAEELQNWTTKFLGSMKKTSEGLIEDGRKSIKEIMTRNGVNDKNDSGTGNNNPQSRSKLDQHIIKTSKSKILEESREDLDDSTVSDSHTQSKQQAAGLNESTTFDQNSENMIGLALSESKINRQHQPQFTRKLISLNILDP